MKSSRNTAALPSLPPRSAPSSSALPFSRMPKTFKASMTKWDSIASQFGLPLSSELTGSPPQDSPTFQMLAETDAGAASSSERPRGLYEELLQSRPEALYVDTLDHPEKYPEEVRTLVAELVNTRRAPSVEERAMLDLAIIDFVAKPPPKGAERPKPPPPKRIRLDVPREEMSDAFDEEEPEAGPPDTSKAFWWL